MYSPPAHQGRRIHRYSAVDSWSSTLCRCSIPSVCSTCKLLRISSGVARKFFRGSKSREYFPSPLFPPFSFLSHSPPFSFLLFPPLLSSPFATAFPPPFPPLSSLRSRTPKIQLRVPGEQCELPRLGLVHFSVINEAVAYFKLGGKTNGLSHRVSP